MTLFIQDTEIYFNKIKSDKHESIQTKSNNQELEHDEEVPRIGCHNTFSEFLTDLW